MLNFEKSTRKKAFIQRINETPLDDITDADLQSIIEDKIICNIGPKTASRELLIRLIETKKRNQVLYNKIESLKEDSKIETKEDFIKRIDETPLRDISFEALETIIKEKVECSITAIMAAKELIRRIREIMPFIKALEI
jgi:hypothetical protein